MWHIGAHGLIQWFEDEFLIVLDLILLEQAEILLAKGAPRVVPLLVADVVDNASELRVAVGEGAKAFLPGKAARHPAFGVDKIGGRVLHVAHEIG